VNAQANNPVVKLFAAPDTAAEQVTQLLLGMTADVLEERGEWWRVRGPDEYTGWADRNAFAPAKPQTEPLEFARIQLPYANLRHAPSSRSGPLMCAPGRATLPLAERRDGWTGLRLPDGRIGWVEAYRTEEPQPRPAEPDAILSTAREYVKVHYLWGGVSGFGIDCSGLAQAVFDLHGIALPRDAHQQAALGASVDRKSVAAGDLVFFASSPDVERERITHVGIAVNRDLLLHAWGSRGAVVESEMDPVAPFWGARRFLRLEG
jgi:hypothetical protein